MTFDVWMFQWLLAVTAGTWVPGEYDQGISPLDVMAGQR